MIKKYIYLKCKCKNKGKLLIKLYKNKINVYDAIYKEPEIYFKIVASDQDKLKKIYGYKFYYYSESGIFKLKKAIPFWQVFSIILFIIMINFLSNIIIEVDVIHSNKDIRNLIRTSLEEKGIKKLSFKKDFNTLEQIKEEIKNTYKDKIEWLEIENVGMKYIVRIEERIINNLEQEDKNCHIVASKNGIIEKIMAIKGEVLVHDGQYVSEGDILISGAIKKEEEIKENVCSTGNVYAEVWYTTKVSIPVSYEEQEYTGKVRLNLRIKSDRFNYKIFKSRIKNTYVEEEQKLFRLFEIDFYKVKEREVNIKNRTNTLEMGVEKAIKLADEKINLKLQEPEYIKVRKVLKKSLNDSTIEVELFYAVVENITKVVEYEEIIDNKDGN